MKIRYIFYLAIMILAFLTVSCEDLKLATVFFLTMAGLFTITMVLSRLADRYE